jgi:hypothetical protein|mmetsp:Transcript_29734/g.53785  ORF Transcript_29734/g.53785 Transcript_29734/m.53785 type:complete len:199 (+) Transcript_29734:39-635(+)
MTTQFFVPPFVEIDEDGAVSFALEEKQARGTAQNCAQQQGRLETCLTDNACDDVYCDVATLSTTTMALDCNASLAWTCVLSLCTPCTDEISNLLKCVGAAARCNFTECDAARNIPVMSPTPGSNSGAPEPTIGDAMLASVMPSIIDDTFMPARVDDMSIPLTSPTTISSAAYSIGGGSFPSGFLVMLVILAMLLMAWR